MIEVFNKIVNRVQRLTYLLNLLKFSQFSSIVVLFIISIFKNFSDIAVILLSVIDAGIHTTQNAWAPTILPSRPVRISGCAPSASAARVVGLPLQGLEQTLLGPMTFPCAMNVGSLWIKVSSSVQCCHKDIRA